jgi:hypothetical protein
VEGEPSGIDPNVYGSPTGVMGFRLFKNPEFVGDAAKAWDPVKYDTDPDIRDAKGTGTPLSSRRVVWLLSHSFPSDHPPADVNNPKWENLASAIGNQYIAEGKVFAPNVKDGGFFAEMLKAQPRGTSDTSRIATDHINNPTRSIQSSNWSSGEAGHDEEMVGESMLIPGETAKMKVPHILKDGADSVGVRGATIRVYINIGMYSQHWLQQHQALLGLIPQKPFSIKAAQENSVYWNATRRSWITSQASSKS